MKMDYFNYDLVKYVIPSYKLNMNNTKKVILIADLHDYTNNRIKSNALAETIKNQIPHHVIIAGDILQGFQWENARAINDLSYFLSNIGEESPVFISQGNHDLKGNNKSNIDIRNNNFMKLSNVRLGKIFPLINDKVTYDGFDIIGFTPSYKLLNGMSNQEHGLAHDMFIEEYNKSGIIQDSSDNIIEFVGHNPHLIAQSENGIGLGSMKNIDTFYTGHLHNGYIMSRLTRKDPYKYLDYGYVEMPFKLDKTGRLLISSINPLILRKTNLCRGVVYIDKDARKHILELRNNHFYINVSKKINKEDWVSVNKEDAYKMILDNGLKALVISGGVKKYSSFNFFNDEPEITEVTYKGMKKN